MVCIRWLLLPAAMLTWVCACVGTDEGLLLGVALAYLVRCVWRAVWLVSHVRFCGVERYCDKFKTLVTKQQLQKWATVPLPSSVVFNTVGTSVQFNSSRA